MANVTVQNVPGKGHAIHRDAGLPYPWPACRKVDDVGRLSTTQALRLFKFTDDSITCPDVRCTGPVDRLVIVKDAFAIADSTGGISPDSHLRWLIGEVDRLRAALAESERQSYGRE